MAESWIIYPDRLGKLLHKTGKADIDSKNDYGQTPLSWAAQGGHEAVVKLLLKTGKADVDSEDNCGQTPLSLAARSGYGAIVKLLNSFRFSSILSQPHPYPPPPFV
jgi:ankyrin repeat protein